MLLFICGLFICSGVVLFSVILFWWLFTFCFAGVVALALTMRTLCHLGVGVESHAPAFCKKCLKKQKKKFVGFWEFCIIFDLL